MDYICIKRNALPVDAAGLCAPRCRVMYPMIRINVFWNVYSIKKFISLVDPHARIPDASLHFEMQLSVKDRERRQHRCAYHCVIFLSTTSRLFPSGILEMKNSVNNEFVQSMLEMRFVRFLQQVLSFVDLALRFSNY